LTYILDKGSEEKEKEYHHVSHLSIVHDPNSGGIEGTEWTGT
jgi:hypothetical protein